MKKLFLALIAGFMICTSCSNCHEHDKSDCDADVTYGIMKLVENSYHHEIWVDTETGCEYFVRNGAHGISVVQLTDSEGKPKISNK